jgi:hypothetical protein
MEDLKSVPMSAILKEMENRFDHFILSSVHSEPVVGEDGKEAEGEFFDFAFNGSKTMALGLLQRSILYLNENIVQEVFGLDEDLEDGDEDLHDGNDADEPGGGFGPH